VLAYSGGIDSAILGALVHERKMKVSSLTMGRKGSSDLVAASERSQSRLQENSIVSSLGSSEIEMAAKKVSKLVKVSNLSHFEDCMAFWLISEKASELKNVEYILSANGPDEVFCGYDRFRRILDSDGYVSVEAEIPRALKIAEDLGAQVRKITSHFGLQICEPFLDQRYIRSALEIPVQLKILPGNDLLRKRIWRCFGRSIKVDEKIVMRPKKAMQYGMGIHSITCSMLKKGTLKLEFPNLRK